MPSGGRAKKPHNKVKTGCMTCRKRRIKCDEAKPACLQCTESLRKCEGYQPPQTWLFRPRKSVNKTRDNYTLVNMPGIAVLQSISPAVSLQSNGDRRSFQFWIEQAAPIFSCYFGYTFWTELLPKLGLDSSRPAIKHMLLATASLVESEALDGVPLDENDVYHTHYRQALRATASSPQTESVLLACLLFACCEFMKGTVIPGLRHIHAGLKILEEFWNSAGQSFDHRSSGSSLIITTIAPIFVSYVDKAPTYGMGDVTTCDTKFTRYVSHNYELPFVGHIEEFHRAHHALDGIAHHIARMFDWRGGFWVASPPDQIQMLLADWYLAFDNFEAKMLETRRQRFSSSLKMLRIFHTLFSIMLHASGAPNETIYDDFELEFEWIIHEYDSLALMWSRDPSSKNILGPGNVDHHMGYIPPLFFTAMKCRTSSLRMAALQHLANLRVIENNWSSCTAYRIASKLIEVENSRCAFKEATSTTIPQAYISGTESLSEHRFIRPVEAYISDRKQTKATLSYTSYPYERDPCTVEEFAAVVDLGGCPVASQSQWPLSRVLRIGGYQGGAVKPLPTECDCEKSLRQKGLPSFRPNPE